MSIKALFVVIALSLAIIAFTSSIVSSAEDSICNKGRCLYPPSKAVKQEPLQAAAETALTKVYYVELHGDYVANGTSLRNEPWDLITIEGIPAGARIVKAFLVWNIMNDTQPPATIKVNGTEFTGTVVGTSGDYCWDVDYSYTYLADVTPVIVGNGVYNISGYPTGLTDFSDPWVSAEPPLAEGASLIVIYEHELEPLRAIVFAVGNDWAPSEYTITWDKPAVTPVEAKNTWIVVDGQNNAPNDVAEFNNVVVAGPGATIRPNDAFPGADHRTGASSYGALWDTLTIDVSNLVSGGSTSATVGIDWESDCIGLVADVFSVRIGFAAGVGGEIIVEEKAYSEVSFIATIIGVTAVIAAMVIFKESALT